LLRWFWFSSVEAVIWRNCDSTVSRRASTSVSGVVASAGAAGALGCGVAVISGPNVRPAPSGKTLRCSARISASILRNRASLAPSACWAWATGTATGATTATARASATAAPMPEPVPDAVMRNLVFIITPV
jgi:hypothetical protein